MDKLGTVGKKDIEEVVDVAQLQVIIHVHKDQDTTLYGTGSQLCYHIMGLVHTKWAPIPGSIKDYIATPKSNGYQVSFCFSKTAVTGAFEDHWAGRGGGGGVYSVQGVFQR